MQRAIDEYRDHLVQTTKVSPKAFGHAYYLRKNCAALGWNTTCDVPSSAFRLMEERWSKPTARLSQWALAAFVRWARTRYRICDAMLAHQVTRHTVNVEDDWDEDDLCYVLGMMRGSDPRLGECPFPMPERCALDRALQKPSNLERGTRLFPIVWLMSRFGVRRAELMAYRVSDWNAARQRLTIRYSATRLKVPRVVEVDPATAAILDALCAGRRPDDYLVRPKHSPRWTGIHLAHQMTLFMQGIGMSGSLTMCHRLGVRAVMRRMPGDLNGAARLLGMATAHYLLQFRDAPAVRAAERRRARAIADELSAMFHVPDPNDGHPQGSSSSPALPTLEDLLTAIRPAPPSAESPPISR